MPLPSLKRPPSTPPVRKIVLLPDAPFFTRSVPVTEGATAAEVSAQVELALETLAPFPLPQLFHGHHWLPGAKHALVFAAYRKRFGAEEAEDWFDAELVVPIFVTALGTKPAAATTLIVPSQESLTAVHYADDTGVPTEVRVAPLGPTATAEDRERVRDELVRGFGGSRNVAELPAPPVFDVASSEKEFVFRAVDFVSTFSLADVAAHDVRDKGDLAALRRARRRDLLLWRLFIGAAAVIALSALLEIGLIAGNVWQQQRLARVQKQAPLVAEIMTAQTLAVRIDELSTKRLRPFEMILAVSGANVKPKSVQFTRTVTSGLYTLEVAEAKTENPADIDVFRVAVSKLPGCEKAEVRGQRTQNGVSTFTLAVTFKPDAFRAAEGAHP